MSTIKELMDEIADDAAVVPPTNWIAADTLTYRKLKTALKRTARELLDRVDWPEPWTKNIVIPGTGAVTYDLPADFLRLTRDDGETYETTGTRRRGVSVWNNGDWTLLQQYGATDGDRFYRLGGDEANGRTISFFRTLASTNSVTVSYIANIWMQSSGDVKGNEWTNVDDKLLLPYDLVELGVRWRSRQGRGLPFASEFASYQAKLARRAVDYRGNRVIGFGDRQVRRWQDNVPDYIPPAP